MNNYAISSDGIATALQDSASALMAAGNNMEQSVALIAAANRVVQDPNSVGSALRTISLRLRGTSVKVLEEMGEETDGVVESLSKMQAKIKALSGVDILTESGEYKDTYTILAEIGKVWEDMSDIDQAALLELMAGKNRANTLAAILSNMKDLEGAYNSALNAEGSALKENEKYLDSIQGRIDLFKNSLQTMWSDELSSDTIKQFVDLGRVLVEVIDKVGLLNSLAGVFFSSWLVKKNFGKENAISRLTTAINENTNATRNNINASQASAAADAQEAASSNQSATAKQKETTELNENASAERNNANASQGATSANIQEAGSANASANAIQNETTQLNANVGAENAAAGASRAHAIANAAQAAGGSGKLSYVPKSTGKKFTIKKPPANNTGNIGASVGAAVAGQAVKQGAKKLAGKTILKSAGKLLGTAIGGFIGGALISAAMSYIPKLIDKAVTTKKELNDSADEILNAYSAAEEKVAGMKSTANDVGKEYEKLSKGVDQFGNNINLSTSEYERYKGVVDQIAQTFPDMVTGYNEEGVAILKCVGSLKALTSAYEEAESAARQDVLNGADDVFGAFQKNYDNDAISIFDVNNSGYKQQLEFAEGMLKLIDDNASSNDIGDFLRGNEASGFDNNALKMFKEAGIDKSEFWSIAGYDYSKLYDERDKLLSFVKKTKTAINQETTGVKTIADAYLKEDQALNYSTLSDNSKSIISNLVSSFDSEFISQFEGNKDAFYDWLQTNIIDVFSDETLANSIEDSVNGLLDIDTQFKNEDLPLEEYKSKVENAVEELNGLEISDDLRNQILQMFGLSQDENLVYDNLDALVNHAKKVLPELQGEIEKLSYSDLQVINSDKFNVDGSTISSWQDLQREIEETKIILTEDFTTANFADYSDSIDSIQSSISSLQSAYESLLSGDFSYDDFLDLIQQFPELAEGVDLASGSFDGLADNLRKAIKNAPDKLTDELKDMREELVKAGKSTKYIDQLIESLENLPEDVVDGIANKYGVLADEIERAARAQNELSKTFDQDTNTGYTTREEFWENAKSLIDQGATGSESKLWTMAAAYFGQDRDAILEKGVDFIKQAQSDRKGWYNSGEDGYSSDGIVEFIKTVANSNIEEELGVLWDYDGKTFSFDLKGKTFQEVATYLNEAGIAAGMTEEEFSDLTTQAGQFIDIDWENKDDIITYFDNLSQSGKGYKEQLDEATSTLERFLKTEGIDTKFMTDESWFNKRNLDSSGLSKDMVDILEKYWGLKKKVESDPIEIISKLKDGEILDDDGMAALSNLTSVVTSAEGTVFIDYTQLEETAKQAGYTEKGIEDLIKKVEEYNNVVGVSRTEDDPLGLLGFGNDTTTIDQYLEAIDVKFTKILNPDKSITFGVNVESMVESLSKANWTPEQIQSYFNSLKDSGLYSFTDNDGNVITLDTIIAEGQIDALVQQQSQLEEPVDTTYNVIGNGYSRTSSIKTWWASIPRTVTTTHTVIEKKEGVNGADGTAHISGTAHSHGTAFKNGSWGADRTETALVGELGPELLVRDGRWTTIGEHGAEFTGIKKGDIIFNHKQTESLLKNGYVTSRGKMHGGAFASGTAYVAGGGGIGSSSSSGKKVSSSYAENEESDFFDFIEIKIEEIESEISKITAKIALFLDDTSDIEKKDKYYDELVKAEKDKAATYKAAMNQYEDKAAELLKDIPKQYRDLAQNGGIAIEEFIGEQDQKTMDAISAYREWAQKADDAEVGYLEATSQAAAYRVEQLDDIATDFENLIAQIESQAGLVETHIDLIEESGNIVSEKFYKDLMDKTKQQRQELVREKADLQKILDDAVASGDVTVGTDEWFEMKKAISDVDKAIIDCDISAEELQNSINDLKFESFERIQNNLDNLHSEMSSIADLLTKNDWEVVSEDGEWTDKGIAALGLYAQQMEVAQTKAQQYGKEIDELNSLYGQGLVSETEYTEQLADLKDKQMDAVNSYEDAKDAIVNLNKVRIDAIKEGIQKEIDAYKELIDKKKESLDADKDIYDFEKSVSENTKNISTIERKIAALRNDNSISATAKRRQLEAELAEAKEALNELYYERSIEDQQKALDSEYENYEKSKNDEMDALDKLLEGEQLVIESFNTVKDNADAVLSEIDKLAETYGIDISESITSPWADGSSAINDYKSKFVELTSSFADEIQEVIQKEKELAQEAEKAAKAVLESLKGDSSTGASPNNASNPSGTSNNNSTPSKTINKGDTVTVSSSATNFSPKSGNAKMESFVPGGSYTVYQTSGDQVLIGRNGVYTGWVYKNDLEGYAKGTKGTKNDEWAWINETGEELVLHAGANGQLAYLTKGTGVIASDLTERLMQLAIDPTKVLENSTPTISAPHIVNNEINVDMSFGSVVNIEHVDQSDIPDLTKAVEKQLDKYMKNLNNQIRKYAR